MFKNNPLLMQLKEGMAAQSEKPNTVVEGTIRGTHYGYGFLQTKDKETFFVSPPEMARCLPGDVVTANVITHPNGKTEAKIEAIVKELTGTFIGTVRIRGAHALIAPESSTIKNWFRIPNLKREDERDGDIVVANIIKHPFETGSAQAEVLSTITHERDRQAAWRVASARHNISFDPPAFDLDDVPAFQEEGQAAKTVDLMDLGFITIDGEYTRDMDDALFAQELPGSDHIELLVAIADPDRFLTVNGPMDTNARERGFTTYFPGHIVSMLPKVLSEQGASLVENEDRKALCCRMTINAEGAIESYRFELADIRSQGKLSYEAVQAFMDGQEEAIAEQHRPLINLLQKVADRRKQWRDTHALSASGYSDYRFIVEDYELKGIEPSTQSASQKLVEECMVAANLSFARYMHEHDLPCVYRHQPGLRATHLDELIAKLSAVGIDVEAEALKQIESFKSLNRQVAAIDDPALSLMLVQHFARSEYTNQYLPHFSMGVEGYATFTSPIRKYCDLINHRSLKQHLLQKDVTVVIDEALINHFNDRSYATNKAATDVQQYLYAKLYQGQAGQVLSASIASISSKQVVDSKGSNYIPVGITVKLKYTGATSFITMKSLNPRGASFTMSNDGMSILKNGKEMLRLAQDINIKIESAEPDKRILNVSIAD